MEILTKLLLSHLITDFILQPKKWVNHKFKHKGKSVFLYLHGLITGLFVLLIFWDIQIWPIAAFVALTHTLIDWTKMQFTDSPKAFFIDQAAHLLILVMCTLYLLDFSFIPEKLEISTEALKITTAYIFITAPAGIIIGKLTERWKNHTVPSLKNAGQWIGITERLLVLTLVLLQQYTAIGFIIAAKSILRTATSREEKQFAQSEYILIGTLLSFAFAIFTGLLIR
ncbi:membrane protein [Marivirga lumbricoides]|uniref:Membrane protein n=1 Tax=Marivirga lumbricoides TaxID=1046115 RepID=A0ABQ1LGF6_9BACT|nr:membrane protein [Marivirga lumbricoides]